MMPGRIKITRTAMVAAELKQAQKKIHQIIERVNDELNDELND